MAMNIIELDQFWDMLGMIPHMLPIMWAKFPSNKKNTWHTLGDFRPPKLRATLVASAKDQAGRCCELQLPQARNFEQV